MPSQKAVIYTALPYVLGTLAVGVAGVAIDLLCISAAAKVAALALTVIPIFTLPFIIACGVHSAGNPEQFKDRIFAYIAGGALLGIAIALITALIPVDPNFDWTAVPYIYIPVYDY